MARSTYVVRIVLALGLLPIGFRDFGFTVALAQQTPGEREGRRDDDGDRRSRWREGREGRSRDERGDRRRSGESAGERGESRPSSPPASSPPSADSSAKTVSPASPSTSTDSGPDMRGYARGLVEKFDKDGDKMLRGDEISSLRGPAAQADLNSDGTITSEEIVLKLSGKAAAAPPATGAENRAKPLSEGSDTSSPNSDAKSSAATSAPSRISSSSASAFAPSARKFTNGERKFYRFKTGKERAPSGLPSYFSRDANVDGQISMHEYASSWTDRTAAAFRALDLNNDGIITAKEAAKSK